MKNYSAQVLKQFLAFCNKQPKSIAVIDNEGKRKTSYEELIRYVNSVSYYLTNNGIHEGDLVVIELENCMEHNAIRISCHLIGAIFLSVDPNYPDLRKKQIYSENNANLIIDAKSLANIKPTKKPIMFNKNTDDNAPGFIIYTSGSTGKPKGIIHNRSIYEILSYIYSHVYKKYFFEKYNKNANDLIHISVCNCMFIMSVIELLSLLYGGTLHIASKKLILRPKLLKQYCNDSKINSTCMIPNMLNAILPLSDMIIAWSGGDTNLDIFNDSQTNIIDYYAASECSFMHAQFLNNSKEVIHFPNCTLKVDNTKNNELCYTGPGIMLGYINNENLTKKTLQKNNKGKIIYRTNDKGILDENHRLSILGRLDTTVKISGNRIDVSDIERNLLTYPNISEAVVKAFDNNNIKYLCAFYTTKNKEQIKSKGIQKHLNNCLPKYMIPNKYIHLKKFNKNQNGKINRTVLQDTQKSSAKETMNNTNNVESNILNVCEKIFKKEIKSNDNLYDFGLSSLICIQILSELEKMNYFLNVEYMLNNPTIDDWAKFINNNKKYTEFNSVKEDIRKYYPLLDTCSMYYDTITELGHIANKIYLFTLSQAFVVKNYNAKQVETALRKVCDAHLGLKAKLIIKDNKPYMLRRDAWQVPISTKILSNKPNIKFSTKQFSPFNVFKDELLRINIYQYEKDSYVYLNLSHFLADGGSAGIFIDDFVKALNEIELKKETFNYFDVSLIQDKLMATKQCEIDTQYYIDQFDKYTMTNFKTKKLGNIINKTKMILNIPQRYTRCTAYYPVDKINSYCKTYNISESSFFLASFMIECAKFNNLDHVLIGGTASYRDDYYSINTIACLFGGYSILYLHSNDIRFLDAAKQMEEQSKLSHEHRMWFKKVGDRVGERSITFNYRANISNSNADWLKNDKVVLEKIPFTNKNVIPLPIYITIERDANNNYCFVFNYQKEIYSKKLVEKFMHKVDTLINEKIKGI